MIGDFTNDLGVLEDKAAELGEKFGQSFQGIVDKVQQARNWFKNLSEEAQNTTLKSAGIGSVIAVGLGPGISALGKGMQSLSKISETTSAFSSLVSSSFKAIPGSFSAVGKGVGSLVGDFKNLGSGLLQPISPLLSKASGLVNGAFEKIGTAIAAPFKKGFSFISDGLGNLVGNIGSKFPKLTGIIASFETNSSGMFSKIGGSISSIMGKAAGFAPVFLKGFNIAAGIGIVFAGLGLLQSGFGDQIDTMLQNVTEKGPLIISNLCYGIANKIPNLINLGGELINNLLNAVIANVPSLLGGGIHIIATLVSSISQQLPKLAPTALSLILKLADSLILNLPKIVTAGLELIMGLVQGLISAVPTLIEAAPTLIAHFVSAIVNMLPKIITTGIILITQLAVGLIQAIPQLISAVPKIINELKNAFSDFDWGSIGRNIIDGIKNGLSSVASNLVQAAKDAGSAALDGIKSMLGIHSPSRVFRDEVGKMMSVGLGIGFVKNLPVKSMVDGVSNAVDRMSASSLSMTANVGTSGLSPVTSHMIEDVSLNYGAAVASSNANSNVIDINSLGDYIVAAVMAQGRQQADALKDGISGMRMTVGGREAGRFISDLGFVRG